MREDVKTALMKTIDGLRKSTDRFEEIIAQASDSGTSDDDVVRLLKGAIVEATYNVFVALNQAHVLLND